MLNDILFQVSCAFLDCLLRRCHDINPHLRRDAVIAVINILKSPEVDVSRMSKLVDCIKERLRDIRVTWTAWVQSYRHHSWSSCNYY